MPLLLVGTVRPVLASLDPRGTTPDWMIVVLFIAMVVLFLAMVWRYVKRTRRR